MSQNMGKADGNMGNPPKPKKKGYEKHTCSEHNG